MLYLKTNDCGSGQLSIPISSPLASVITYQQFVALYYRGAYRGGFFIENMEIVDVSSSEYSGLVINISGRGVLSFLTQAIVWDYTTPGNEDIKYFGTKDTSPFATGGPVPKARMLFALIRWARDQNTKAGNDSLDRYCWRQGNVKDGQIMLALDWTVDLDSDGVAWTDEEEMEFRVGTNVLDVLKQIAALQYDFKMDFYPSTIPFTLHAYNDRLGSDLTSEIYFRAGHNCQAISRFYSCAEIANALLIEFTHPENPFYHGPSDVPGFALYRRHESLLQSSNASDQATGQAFGEAELLRTKNPAFEISIEITDAVGPRAFVDYDLFDQVSFGDGRSSSTIPIQITGIQLTFNEENPYATVVIESSST